MYCVRAGGCNCPEYFSSCFSCAANNICIHSVGFIRKTVLAISPFYETGPRLLHLPVYLLQSHHAALQGCVSVLCWTLWLLVVLLVLHLVLALAGLDPGPAGPGMPGLPGLSIGFPCLDTLKQIFRSVCQVLMIFLLMLLFRDFDADLGYSPVLKTPWLSAGAPSCVGTYHHQLLTHVRDHTHHASCVEA